LPGDIHKNAEIDLIKSLTDIKSTILISPHHGSKTSSSIEFIKQVSPSWVIHSSAFNGRWLMPHYEIVQRYADLNVQQLITGISGHIRIKIFEHEYLIESTRSKQSYWFLVN
jgi:competence protein ComEC